MFLIKQSLQFCRCLQHHNANFVSRDLSFHSVTFQDVSLLSGITSTGDMASSTKTSAVKGEFVRKDSAFRDKITGKRMGLSYMLLKYRENWGRKFPAKLF